MSAQMLNCIQSSVSDEGALKVVTSVESFKIKIKDRSHSLELANWPLYLKSWSHGSPLTLEPQYYRTLSTLDDYMTSVYCSVTTLISFDRLKTDPQNDREGTSSNVHINFSRVILKRLTRSSTYISNRRKMTTKKVIKSLRMISWQWKRTNTIPFIRGGKWNVRSKKKWKYYQQNVIRASTRRWEERKRSKQEIWMAEISPKDLKETTPRIRNTYHRWTNIKCGPYI